MFKRIGKWTFLALLIMGTGFSKIAIENALSTKIHLKSRLIDTEKVSNTEFFQALSDVSEESVCVSSAERTDFNQEPLLPDHDSINTYLIQFRSALGPSDIQAFEKRHGLSILSYIPDNAYIMRSLVSTALQLASSQEVHWIGPLLPTDKYSPDLRPHLNEEESQLTPLCIMAMHVAENSLALSSIIQQTLSDDIERLRVTSMSSDRIEVCFEPTPAIYDLILAGLALRTEILYLYNVPIRRKLNQYAEQIVWSGNQRADNVAASVISQLSGAGQIIGCGDTGLDPDHCFFHDPHHRIPMVNYDSIRQQSNSFDLKHRKVVQYVRYTKHGAVLLVCEWPAISSALITITSDGHGTHVAGTLVGKPWDYNPNRIRDIDKFSGIAMDAKLAFFDITEKEAWRIGLNVPKVLDESYFGWAYAAGARIHSNSWSSISMMYDMDAYDIDMYSWIHKDFLPVFAAGNNGTLGPKQVSSQCSAKNSLCVGSSVSSSQSFKEVFCPSGFAPNYFVCQQANSENQHLTENDMAYFSSMGPTLDGRIKPDVVAPGHYILSAKNAPDQAESCDLELTSLLLVHSGTSMSAPVMAATLSLVRQYFMEGFYPTGVKGAGTALNPSAALVKAVAVSGAVSLAGFRHQGDKLDSNYRPLKPAPNFVQGFGRTQLDTVLKLAGPSRFDLIVGGYKEAKAYQDREFRARGEYHEYKVCILGNSRKYLPRFTLVWTDYPASPLSAVAIVNDLDVHAQFEINDARTNTTYLSVPIYLRKANDFEGPDTINTVERIELKNAKRHDVVIVRVTAASLHNAPQPYALLITGQLAVVEMHESCDLVKGRHFAADPMDVAFDDTDRSLWYDFFGNEVLLLSALACIFIVVFTVIVVKCLKLWRKKRQQKSGVARLAPEDAAVFAARSLSIP